MTGNQNMTRSPANGGPQAACPSPPRGGKHRPTAARGRRSVLCGLALLSMGLLAGCSTDLETVYGRRTGLPGARSVNGTAVLANLFEQAGHKVATHRALTPALHDEADVIVWFPNSFSVPSKQVIAWLRQWVDSQPGRTLVYVGRDYDAAAAYWEAVIPGAPAAESAELQRRLNEARLDASLVRHAAANEQCSWFALDYKSTLRSVHTLSGPWSKGVDPKQVGIELEGRLEPRGRGTPQTLLASGKDILAARLHQRQGGGQIILIANGSFLLNFPLVNHEHRKLAAQLVAAVGPARQVAFLESGPHDVEIRNEETAASIPSGLDVFGVWPLNLLLLHIAVLGIVFCLSRWPIFGRPLAPAEETVSDFGKHIDALGELLERTGDRGYAKSRLLHYQQAHRVDSAAPSPAHSGAARISTAELAAPPGVSQVPPQVPEDRSSP